MQVESQITIKAPLGKVFEVFSDLSRAEERVEGIKKIEILNPPAQMQLGTKWEETRVMFGKEAKEIMWVTEVNQNKNYVVEAESHGTHYRSEYTFEETGDAVLVKMVFEGKPLSFAAKLMSFMFLFFAKSTKKLLEQDMADLKKVCEGKALV
jgi:uncharacterized membrane protein